MKKIALLGTSLLLSFCLVGCGGGSSTSLASSTSSVSSSDSSVNESVATLTTQAEFEAALKKEHSFQIYTCTTNIYSGSEQISNSYIKKEIDIVNYIEHIYSFTTTMSSINGNNSDSSYTSSEIYKSASDTYTKQDTGLYTSTSGSDASFKAYSLKFDFSKIASYTFSKDGFDGVLSGDVSDISGFTASSSFASASNMKAVASLSSDGALSALAINYTDGSYTVKLSYSFTYIAPALTLPTV